MCTNLSFSSNVNIIKSVSQSKGDKEFLSKVSDYYALLKLRNVTGGTNTSFYRFNYKQIEIVSPEFAMGCYVPRKKDPAIIENNTVFNKVYGYDDYREDELYPLIDELYLDYGQSIWDNSGHSWWYRPGFYKDGFSGTAGVWKEVSKQEGTVEKYGGGSLFTSYIKQEIERAENKSDDHIPISAIETSELNEPDPYYYIYKKTAGIDEEIVSNYENEKATKYIKKYGLFSAFEEVEQEKIIMAPSSNNIFVDAGPGTGKTYTLIHRINNLVEEQEVDPEGILVLCFTNAAVAEVKKRRDEYIEHGGSRALRKVDIRTFHSFAWWLIGEANNALTDDGWKPVNMTDLSYDGSIAKATQTIRQFTDEVMGGWEHFIVDEIQDLTDVRGRLVLEIVKGCLKMECGMTVLGDSCQAIYDYNQENIVNPLDSQKFYESLFNLLYEKADFYKLTLNHRQTDELIAKTVGLRKAILEENKGKMRRTVMDLYKELPNLPNNCLTKDGLHTLAGKGNVCLLCRNNGQVLRLSSNLRKKGIEHIVNAYDHNKCYATWIGHVFFGFDKEMISYEEFEKLYLTCNNIEYDPEDIWARISNMLGKPENNRLGTIEVLRAIYYSQIDDTVFYNKHSSNIIVSNIHKAKGREYEAVVVEENFIQGLSKKENKEIGEYKTLYVAITRPKKKLYSARMVGSDGLRITPLYKTGRKRWTKGKWKNITHMEIQGSIDINHKSFKMEGKAVQEYLSTKVNVGDEIILRRSKSNEIFGYNIIHLRAEEETVVGRCTKRFEEDLEVLTGTEDKYQWPCEIRDLYVNDVYTEIFESVTSEDVKSPRDSVWNWIDFCGLGRLIYDVY